MMASRVVRKFGGTSVADGARIAAVARLLDQRGAAGSLVVVSAMAGVTDSLIRVGELAQSGHQEMAEKAIALLAELEARHRQAVVDAGLGYAEAASLTVEIDRAFCRLREQATGMALLGEQSPRTSDALLATGELLSSRLVAVALAGLGVHSLWLDPRELLATDASFAAAIPDEGETAARVRRLVVPELEAGRCVVTGGFVGGGPGGETTTLGRGGSDYSAALLAAALNATELEIWTDVDGILSADPRLVPEARLVPVLSYSEASELAFFGAKVLHPATIRPAVRTGVPVRILNTFRPEGSGTEILAEADGSGVRAVAARHGTAALFISNPRMLLAHGYAARVFAVFERHRAPVDVIATSEVSISVTVDAGERLTELIGDLREFADVDLMRDLAVVSIVGQRLRTTPGIAARVFTALGDINVVMISQGGSETNLTFVVRESDAAEAVRRLHAVFFGAAGAVEAA